jgi:hypothetical protein
MGYLCAENVIKAETTEYSESDKSGRDGYRLIPS